MVRVYFIHNFKSYAQEINRIFSILFIIFSASSISVSAQEQWKYTIDSYKEFLKQKDYDSYEKFIALNAEQKQVFLDYINNPKKMLEDADNKNSPIQVSIKTEEKNLGHTGFRSFGSLQYKNISQTYTQSLFVLII